MAEINIFVSVGGTANDEQETFVRAVEERLRSEGFNPHTVGRNTFSADAPLKTVNTLLDKCSGTVVIALERTYFSSGVQKRNGPQEVKLSETCLSTPWNQIEAALSYGRGLPLLVIVADTVKSEGLLEPGYDWYVQRVKPITASLNSNEFNGVLSSWKQKIASTPKPNIFDKDLSKITINQFISASTPGQLWSVLGAMATIVSISVAIGAKFFGGA